LAIARPATGAMSRKDPRRRSARWGAMARGFARPESLLYTLGPDKLGNADHASDGTGILGCFGSRLAPRHPQTSGMSADSLRGGSGLPLPVGGEVPS
jgi:hypothetical protein